MPKQYFLPFRSGVLASAVIVITLMFTSHKYIGFFLILLVSLPACSSEPQNSDTELTFICNTGYSVRAGDVEILIDPFCRSKHYINTPDSVLSLMANGVEPFGETDILLVTHVHPDHFNDSLAAAFLMKQTGTSFISSDETCDSLKDLPATTISRLNCLDLGLGETATVVVNDIQVTAIRLRHTGNAEVRNLAFLVETPECTFFHTGDAMLGMNEEFINTLPWDSISTDILFIGFYDKSPLSLRLIREKIKPKKIVLMHATAENIPLARQYAETDFPGALVFEKPLESIHIVWSQK